jgi:glycerol-3-phosphate dehydrogenase
VIAAPTGPATFLTAQRRAQDLERLADEEPLDLLVIGGGVTGAGVALDASTRGLRVGLIERRDLASGTSSMSSKLVHGGLRYLAHGDFPLAWESARERDVIARVSAPHLLRALPQLTPIWGRLPSAAGVAIEAGVRAGDAMRALAGTSRRRLPGARRISAAEARLWAPALRSARLRGAILAWDGQLEDDARLVVALARTAAGHGARLCTYCEALALDGDGALARDTRTGEELRIRARHVVNATGVWAGQLVDGLPLRPSRGAHLIVRAGALGTPRAAVNVALAGSFSRFALLIPRTDGTVLVGLTDTPHEAAAIPDDPPVSAEDERFLLDAASRALERPISRADVVGRFAGLRPLLGRPRGGATADLSRRHAVLEDERTGAVTILGGKLTTYRRMAQDALDHLVRRRGLEAGPCRTEAAALVGAPQRGQGRPAEVPERLWRRFGSEAGEIAALADGRPELLGPLAPGVPVLGVELLAAVEREGALSEADVLDRRTRAGLVAPWRQAALEALERLYALAPQAP